MDSAEYHRKLARAFTQAGAAGISSYSYNPYFDRAMRRLGCKPVPLHYAGWVAVLRLIPFFAIVISITLLLVHALSDLLGAPPARAEGIGFFVRIGVTGIIVSAFVSLGQVWEAQSERRKCDLPKWEDL